MKEEYKKITMSDAEVVSNALYADDDIVLITDIHQLPHEQDNIRVDAFILIGCAEGKMSVSVDGRRYTLHPDDLLLCVPNTVLDDCMMSPDFKGGAACLSYKAIHESIHMDSGMIERGFRLRNEPVIHVGRESIRLLSTYHSLALQRLAASSRLYGKEVIGSLMRAMLYELLAELSVTPRPDNDEPMRQKDVLFKRFMELISSCEVKPRSVVWYSEKLCVTPKYLSTVCKQVSGKTAFDWINECMMTDIRRLLRYSDKSIKELTDYLDFPNISFFGKYVKQHTGFNPTDYRKKLRETDKKK